MTAALLLDACGAPPPPAAPSADGEAYAFDPAQLNVLAVGFGMLAPDFLPAPHPALAPADLAEVADGVWFGGIVAVGAEATYAGFEGIALSGLVALTAEGTFLMAASNREIDGGRSLSDFAGDVVS